MFGGRLCSRRRSGIFKSMSNYATATETAGSDLKIGDVTVDMINNRYKVVGFHLSPIYGEMVKRADLDFDDATQAFVVTDRIYITSTDSNFSVIA
jgi:hypothetical protein